MNAHFLEVWAAYFKQHKKDLPLISTILTADELASPELEAVVEAYLAQSVYA